MRRLAAFLITLALVGMPVTWAWADPKHDPGPSPNPNPNTDQQPSQASVAPPSEAASAPTEPAVPTPPTEPVPTPTWPTWPGLPTWSGLPGHLNLPQASHKPNDNWVHTFLLKPHLSAPTEFLSIATHNIPSSNCAGVRQSRRAAPNGGRATRASSHVSC